MNIDAYTKSVLTVIALCLVVLTLEKVNIIPNAMAASVTTCKGELIANAWGGVEASIGGYKVELNCN